MSLRILEIMFKFVSRFLSTSDQVRPLKDDIDSMTTGNSSNCASVTASGSHSSEAMEYVGELHISNPNGLYLELPTWPDSGFYQEFSNVSKIPTRRTSVSNSYDDQSIEFFNLQKIKPMPMLTLVPPGLWAFGGSVVRCHPTAEGTIDPERLALLIECCVDSFTNSEHPSTEIIRKSIPRNVKLFVWQRDQGRCVECGSQANLEFDHVIPVIKGGSSTERNIRLLCESCNCRKGPNL